MATLEQLRCGALAGTRRLQLRCDLTHFPEEIYALADTLEILDLSGNALVALPDDLWRLGRLQVLFCSENRFTELPAVLGRCRNLQMIGFKANRISHVPEAALPPRLRWLILTDNAIEALPSRIGQCSQLQKLMLAGNRLTTLPRELGACRDLALLRISANRLAALPAWLASMPNLAWLACAGNPFSQALEDKVLGHDSVKRIDWNHLTLGEKLGEGASGVIHRALHRRPGASAPAESVAVKLFKGTLTSDGLPQSEIAACLQAGQHAGLIPILGRIENHPSGMAGMMMPLIAAGLVNLAAPPSLASCSRDVYAENWRLELPALLGMTLVVAGAARHLHVLGIMHGDLYGHNILHDQHGHALLGDFGAASLYDTGSPHAAALQRLEVRAFGYLLEELLARVDLPAQGSGAQQFAVLAQLCCACLQPRPDDRPSFEEIEVVLLRCTSSGQTSPRN
ncbi:MAG: leucine-rich repeat-containing protein kinase family protein [Janthinobacterium lividum]